MAPPRTWLSPFVYSVNGLGGLRGLLVLLCLGLGCSHTHRARSSGPDADITRLCAEGSALNDEELFAAGSAAFGAEEFEGAARCLERLAETHPNSRYLGEALFKAGLARERLGEWETAYSRFSAVADPAHGQGVRLDSSFRQAETLYHLGRFDEARALLDTLAAREDLPAQRRLEARVQRGVCEMEAGALEAAEASLRQAVDSYSSLKATEEVDDYFPAQAQFFLGELYRLHCEEVHLDPGKGVEALSAELEYKAQLLLSAQGHYLRTIRMGQPYWATAAGAQIGLLYEELYEEMTHAVPPRELEPDQAELYRAELHKKVRVLLTKAISAYEQTLEAAERIGSTGPFVEKTRESLKRMKNLLIAEAESELPEPAPPSL